MSDDIGKLADEVISRRKTTEELRRVPSWGGFTKRLLHEAGRAEQLVVLIKDERARAEQAEAQLAEAKSVLRHESDCIEAAKEHIASLESTLSAMENESIEKDRLGAEMLGERNARIASLEKSVTVLRQALDRVLIGVNHIATYKTDAWPKPGTAPMEALDKLGAGKEYDMWCCWNAAMTNRDVLAQTVAARKEGTA